MAKLGYFSREGNPFNILTIRHILENPKYKGWYCGNKTQSIDYRTRKKAFLDESEWVMYPDPTIPAIVSEDLWNRANALYKERRKETMEHSSGSSFQNRYPYSTKIICGKHGSTFHRHTLNNKSGAIEAWQCKMYRQKGKEGCSTPQIRSFELDLLLSKVFAHLAEEDRTAVMAVASQIVMADEHEKMHPKVATCYKKAKAGDSMDVVNFIAKESLPRAIKILDTLVKAAIPLGIEVDDKLQFSIGKDKVYLRFSEATKEVPHQLTKQEKMALLEYEDAKKQKRWAREPQIRKYDHIYNGTLSLGINDKRRFRDSKLGQIEDRLGEVLVAIFYCINEAKLAREEREEAERKREEERRCQEEIKKRYNEEVAKTKALLNQANDFEIATKIRSMAAAAEANGSASEEWLAWARAKADWYDPTVAATDEFFGKRKHEEKEDKKALREKGSYYSYW